MNPRAYVPAYLEHRYALAHPELTNAARELVHEQIERDPDRYATDDGARALVSYMRVQEELLDGLLRMEDLPDGDFERDRSALFERARAQLAAIMRTDPHCVARGSSPYSSPRCPSMPAWAICSSSNVKLGRDS